MQQENFESQNQRLDATKDYTRKIKIHNHNFAEFPTVCYFKQGILYSRI